MIDPLQILFIVVITVLTVLLIIIGIEVYRTLQEAKKTLKRMNHVLDDVETITSSVALPVEKLSGIIEGFHQGASIIHFLTNIIERKKHNQSEKEAG